MSNQIVRSQMEDVRTVLKEAVEEISTYLNGHSIEHLLKEEGSEDKEYYQSLMKSLRRLEVFCDEAYDTVHVILSAPSFRKPAAEKTLYGIYHQCIMEFFSPKGDVWYEDSRAAYTGKNALRYREQPPYSFQALMNKLEDSFQQIREDLAYYETDYQTKMVMNEEPKSSPS